MPHAGAQEVDPEENHPAAQGPVAGEKQIAPLSLPSLSSEGHKKDPNPKDSSLLRTYTSTL